MLLSHTTIQLLPAGTGEQQWWEGARSWSSFIWYQMDRNSTSLTSKGSILLSLTFDSVLLIPPPHLICVLLKAPGSLLRHLWFVHYLVLCPLFVWTSCSVPLLSSSVQPPPQCLIPPLFRLHAGIFVKSLLPHNPAFYQVLISVQLVTIIPSRFSGTPVFSHEYSSQKCVAVLSGCILMPISL